MQNGKYQAKDVGSGTDVWTFIDEVRGGRMTLNQFMDAEASMARSAGHCMTMGTASTMASMVESIGISLTGNAAIPAVDSRRYVLAHMSGQRIVEMVKEDLCMSTILTRSAFENVVRVNGAIGGSTNAVIHLIALAGRIGIDFSLDDWDKYGKDVPTLVDLMPSGRFLMEDFYYAGGIPAVIRELEGLGLINRDALTVNGKTIWENCENADCWNREVVRTPDNPVREKGGIVVLRGNLAETPAAVANLPPGNRIRACNVSDTSPPWCTRRSLLGVRRCVSSDYRLGRAYRGSTFEA